MQRFAFEAMRAAFDLVACLSGDRRLQGIQQTRQFVDKHRRQLVEQRRIVVQLRERKRIIEGEYRSRDDLRNFLRQFLQQDGFGNVTVKAELQAFFSVAFHGVCGHGDDPLRRFARRLPPLCLTNRLYRFDAVHFRHLQIH